MRLKEKILITLKFCPYLSFEKKGFILILILGVAGTFLGLINPFLAKLAIDNAFANNNLRFFIKLFFLGGGVFFINKALEVWRGYAITKLKWKLTYRLHREIFSHLGKLSLDYFRNKSQGEYLYTVAFELERVTVFLVEQIPDIFLLIIKIIATLAIIAFLSWKLALLAILLGPFLYLTPWYFAKKRELLWQSTQMGYEKIINRLTESFLKQWLIKAMGMQDSELRMHLCRLKQYIRVVLRANQLELLRQFVNDGTVRLITGMITFLAGYAVVKKTVSLGNLSAITLYLNQLVGLHSNFISFLDGLTFSAVSFSRIDEILKTRPAVQELSTGRDVVFGTGPEIEFRNVYFSYVCNKLVFSGLSFKIPAHTHIALVGPSGCGKTTLVNLILRLYEPLSGDIFISGCNIKNIKLRTLRRQLGVALQEPFLWNLSIEDNIRYSFPKASFEQVRNVAELCLVDEFVRGLKEGYATIIGEAACRISEGQKQKIAIARAILKQPNILILDEALSSMDAQSEERIMRNIKKEFSGLTIISVSHRLSTVMAADLVYFLVSPQQVLIGPPWELLNREPRFQALFATERLKQEQIDVNSTVPSQFS